MMAHDMATIKGAKVRGLRNLFQVQLLALMMHLHAYCIVV
jgi:hypothetical protein